MRLEMKREAELEKRKGQTVRTILAVLWLVISFAVSYLAVGWLFGEEYLEYEYFYQSLMVPGNISESAIKLGMSFVIFLTIQFIVLIIIAALSPTAKRKSGKPRADTDDPDPYAKSINYH
jgi:preprotein translocase subunit SecG